jgi:WD40 repeat protein
MSPEQACGQHDQVGPASDVYSLGATLYVLLTGRPPFQEQHLHENLVKVRQGDFPPPREVNRKAPAGLAAVCLKAMALKPENRYPSALALAADLEHWLADEPVSAWREPATARVRRWLVRNCVLATAAVVTLAALAVVAAVTAFYSAATERERAAKEQARADREQEHRAREVAELRDEQKQRELEKADRAFYFDSITRAEVDWYRLNFADARRRLDACTPKLRGWEWNYLKRLCEADLLTLGGGASHAQEVWDVAFSPDTDFTAGVGRLATAGLDGAVKLWALPSGRLLRTLVQGGKPARSVAFSPDGKLLASAGDDRTVRLWDAETGEEKGVLDEHSSTVRGVAFSPDGKLLAAAVSPVFGGDGAQVAPGGIKVWDVDSRKESFSLTGPTAGAYSVAFSPNGKLLASAGPDFAVRLWDVASRNEIKEKAGQRPRRHASAVSRVAFSPDGAWLASASHDRSVCLWNGRTGEFWKELRSHSAPVWGVAFSPDSKCLATSGDDAAIDVWDVAQNQLQFTLRGHKAGIASIAFSPDGKRLASVSDDQTARLWDVTSRQAGQTLSEHRAPVWAVAFSPDGRRVASASDDFSIKVWDAATGKVLRTLRGPTGSAGVAFSPDGKHIAAAFDDGAVRVWNAETGREEKTLWKHKTSVWSVAFSPDSRRLASGGGGGVDAQGKPLPAEVIIWDVDSGKDLRTLQGHTDLVWKVAFSPDGRLLASASQDRSVKLWNPDDGELLRTLTSPGGGVLCVAFSPDGKRLAAATAQTKRVLTSEAGEVVVWDLETSQKALKLGGHIGSVRGVTFSPNGQRLATASEDRTLKIWEAQTGQELLTLRGHAYEVSGAAFSPDGHRLASSSFDGTVMIWNGMPPP